MHYKFRLFIRNYYIVNGIVNLIKKINHRYDGTIILVDLDDFHDIPRFHISHEDVVIYITKKTGNDSNLLIVFYVQIMPDDFVMQLHRF